MRCATLARLRCATLARLRCATLARLQCATLARLWCATLARLLCAMALWAKSAEAARRGTCAACHAVHAEGRARTRGLSGVALRCRADMTGYRILLFGV